ncbi:putative sulfate exporter family transporter [Maribius pontilimi]|uniref:Sulfate exporter family transporter n=1 Tax=Palleronia pontilimi TaxID=1964209 RepID=A0A934MD45_9RHOB|nr:putative sulfate exporter family transporter [Palleronia pontilimi]MBJ3761956.1 putative sulfate exporter family transporter [Palleronia pontilimi]
MTDAPARTAPDRMGHAKSLIPGLLIVTVIALASSFVAEHYGAPAMLLALLFGIAMNFLSEDPRSRPGIEFGAKTVLRIGVALLGVRISADVLGSLGWAVVALVVVATALTIGFGFAVSRLFGFKNRFAFLSAGAVAICGASAAMAIAAILPKDDRSDERLIFTVVGVTVLSTLAMVIYPVLTGGFGWDDRQAGMFIGATVHDVAQVVGAGYSISDEAGVTATLVKLLRVLMLAPVVVIAGLVIRARNVEPDPEGGRPPLVPTFVAGFVGLAVLNSLGLLPSFVVAPASAASGWALLAAIAAVGLRTVPQQILNVGPKAVGILAAETVFLAVFIGLGLTFAA